MKGRAKTFKLNLDQGDPKQSWILDSRYWIPVFISGTWNLDYNC